MKKITAFAVLTLIFLSVFSGCRSSEGMDFVSETDTVPVYPVQQPQNSGKTADSVKPIETEREDIQIFPKFDITEDSEPALPETFSDIQSYQPTVTEQPSSPVKSENLRPEPESEPEPNPEPKPVKAVSIVSPEPDNSGIIILVAVLAVGVLSFAYYFFIFRKKVTK